MAKLRYRLGDQGGVAAAVREARAITRAGRKSMPIEEWRVIAKTCGELGDAKTVADLAGIVPGKAGNRRGNPRHTLLREAAMAAARAGHLTAAEQIADASPDEPTRKSVRAFIRLGAERSRLAPRSVADAMKAAERLPTAAEEVRAFVGRAPQTIGYQFFGETDGVAAAQLRAGDTAGAKRTALHIGAEDQFWYTRVVRSIAQAQARDGRAAVVRAWAAKMDDGLLRANALFGLADGLYREPAKAVAKSSLPK